MNTVLKMIKQGLATLLLGALTFVVQAHPGHGEPISREEAVQRASAQIDRLVAAGKIEKSWKVRGVLQTAELEDKGDAKEWALSFANPQASAQQQRTLYVFLSETGEYLAANFTGR
jgi:hypothetical protein